MKICERILKNCEEATKLHEGKKLVSATVLWYNKEKEYGYVEIDNGDKVLILKEYIPNNIIDKLEKGDKLKVSYAPSKRAFSFVKKGDLLADSVKK